jgi:hypothetical protein
MLQECLDRPRFALAGTLPQQGRRFFNATLADHGDLKTFLELSAVACDADWIA